MAKNAKISGRDCVLAFLRKLVVCLTLSVLSLSSFADNAVTGSGTECVYGTLNTYTGPSTIKANWDPNTINLYWYNGNQQLSVQSSAQTCSYDGMIVLPSTDPTKTGYTFTGWEVAPILPSAYTQLEYIQSDGSQSINTGFVPDTTSYTHKIVFEVLSTGTGYVCGTGSSNGRSGNVKVSNNAIIGIYNGLSGATAIASSGTLVSGKNTLILKLNNNAACQVTLNGTSINNSSAATINSGTPMALFSITVGSSSIPMRIYADSVEKNGSLVYNLVPARRNSDSVLGMYDTVSGAFKTNGGSGTFTAGPDAL